MASSSSCGVGSPAAHATSVQRSYGAVATRSRRSRRAWKGYEDTTAETLSIVIENKARSYYGNRAYAAYVKRRKGAEPEAAIVLECRVVQEHRLPPSRTVFFAEVLRGSVHPGVTDANGRLDSTSRRFFGMTSGNGEFWTFGERVGTGDEVEGLVASAAVAGEVGADRLDARRQFVDLAREVVHRRR